MTRTDKRDDVADYDPLKFLRCHSKNKDSADVQTQVWHCAFEPDVRNPSQTTSIVATCGGNSVCFIDCNSGQVLNKYYAKNLNDLLFTLSWTSVTCLATPGRVNILVTAGSKSTLHFIERKRNKCIIVHKLKSRSAIHSLCFHPREENILFCGTSDGIVQIFGIKYNSGEDCSINIQTKICVESEIFDMAFCTATGLLLASCNDGLVAIPYSSKHGADEKRQLGDFIRLNLPDNPMDPSQDSKLVDSVEVLGNGLLACKPALHGRIYVCDLKTILKANNKKVSRVDLTPHWVLPWSDTDNYFMYMGLSRDPEVLVCGDDKGSLWLYDISSCYMDYGMNKFPELQEIEPHCIIPWPKLTDHYGDKKRKLNLHVYDIVIDKVALDSKGQFIVAVTNNNMVCIWKRVI